MKVVCIGGGTGLAISIEAWLNLGVEVTAIVATTDNGGCSGRLRQAGSPVPWGDLRKAVAAMTPKNADILPTLALRYAGLGQLSGHCVGNLMLEAFYQQTGNVTQAVACLGKQSGAKGTVLPMCESPADLVAITKGKQWVVGETQIDALPAMPQRLLLNQALKAPAACIDAIEQADVICIGPGSLITSVMPALLVENIKQALSRFAGPKLLIHNIHPEQSPAANIQRKEVSSWVNLQCGGEVINSELLSHELRIKHNCYPLQTALRGHSKQQKSLHDVSALTKAFALVKARTLEPQRHFMLTALAATSYRPIVAERFA